MRQRRKSDLLHGTELLFRDVKGNGLLEFLANFFLSHKGHPEFLTVTVQVYRRTVYAVTWKVGIVWIGSQRSLFSLNTTVIRHNATKFPASLIRKTIFVSGEA